MGSVKDLKILKEATLNEPGIGRFIFSDRYSVFDWGEMPDLITHKGESIAILGAYFFEKLEKMGIKTHYSGLVNNNLAEKIDNLKNPSNELEVKILRVLKPSLNGGHYDYSTYKNENGNFLIPLEVIYRNSLPEGSSVFKRLKNKEITYKDLGLNSEPKPNQKLNPPIYDVSTKLEITDRYISWNEAKEISQMKDNEISNLKKLLNTVNSMITDEFAKIGLVNEDGKIEVGFNKNREIIAVDVLGTLDECRFTYKGLPVSKEIARIHYRKTKWYKAVEEAKAKDRQNWKTICALKPEPLSTELRDAISNIYCSCTNEITGKKWFKNIPSLKETLKTLPTLL